MAKYNLSWPYVILGSFAAAWIFVSVFGPQQVSQLKSIAGVLWTGNTLVFTTPQPVLYVNSVETVTIQGQVFQSSNLTGMVNALNNLAIGEYVVTLTSYGGIPYLKLIEVRQ